MRKIYSLVLMTAMLFVGANAWATVRQVNDAATFEAAWTAAQNGDVIQLTNAVSLTNTMWLGTENMGDTPRSFEIDLNGFDLTSSATYAFMLTHGSLKISNSRSAVGGQLTASGTNVFYITGSTNKDVDSKVDGANYFTHLEIAEGVIITHTKYDAAISIDHIWKNGTAFTKQTSYIPSKPALTYITNVYADTETQKNKGVANGVRLDVKGTINGTKYGIKTNGLLGSPTWYYTRSYAKADSTVAFSSTLLPPATYTNNMNDTKYSPFVYVHSTGRITVNQNPPAGQSKSPVGLYAGGYARWKVEGYAEGGVGALVKSGEVDFKDATIQGTGTSYNPAQATTSGTNASGSAIVIESSGAYAGDIDVTIEGDSKISADNGYAVDENVTTSNNQTKVDAITITGGTFDGGNVGTKENPQEGTIKVTETTVNNTTTTVTVNGGTVTGTGENNVNIGGQDLAQYLADQSTTTHITYVEDAEGHTTIVISEGGAPGATTTVSGATANSSVTWKTGTVSDAAMVDVIASDLALDELVINDTTTTGAAKSQTLTINAGKTLEVKRVILGAGAQIVVEAGAKFLVTGNQGITANYVDNIKLKANADAQATFVIKGNVNSNRQPKATVEFTPKCAQMDATNYLWQRFSVPVIKVTSNPTNSYSTGNPNLYNNETSLRTYAKFINDETQSWQNISSWSQLRIFQASSITNNTTVAEMEAGHLVTYTFTGQLVGNVTDSLNLKNAQWNYYGNGFIAPMSVKSLLTAFAGQPIAKAIYKHQNDGSYKPINSLIFEGFPTAEDHYIPALGFFVVKNTSGVAGTFNINYDNTVYNYAVNPLDPQYAPTRSMNNSNKVCINIESESGLKDAFYMVEASNFRAEFEEDADMEKLMNLHGMNIYAANENENYAMLATDNVLGTLLSLNTVDDINYTLSFSNVGGEVYALRDNMTNTIVLMNEGATYNFTAQPNATLEGRFQIVSRQEMPTAVETIEETVAPKAIYTVMGQYVGETTDWNNLPAGVYVVDGVKVIK